MAELQNPATDAQGAPAPAAVPYVFFSYARSDKSEYLKRFFNDVGDRLTQLVRKTRDELRFFDEASIETGADWNTRIADALKKSNVFVCLYSPTFFSPDRTHEYCAKEFYAFMTRAPGLRYENVIVGSKTWVAIRDTQNIIPIQWLGELDLAPQNLPPAVLYYIQASLNAIAAKLPQKALDLYKEEGMERLARSRGVSYSQVVNGLARLVFKCAQTPPPPPPAPPDFNTLRNAFWDLPAAPGALVSVGRMASLKAHVGSASGPRKVLAIVLQGDGPRAQSWFASGAPSPSAVLEELVLRRRMQFARPSVRALRARAFDEVCRALKAETQANTTLLLVAEPACLEQETGRTLLRRLLAEPDWRGGVLLAAPVTPAQRAAVAELARLTADQQQRIVVRTEDDGGSSLAQTALGLLDDVAARIVKHGEVQRPAPGTDGPDVRPTITNVTPQATTT
ncbi:MAG TPA: toll/interleukin-1 receptor domain-containing protein [Burkholderiales bacterium]|nr:toll/interleukin-1 receptor domain-containing protein [Burkholderiales bacterium]